MYITAPPAGGLLHEQQHIGIYMLATTVTQNDGKRYTASKMRPLLKKEQMLPNQQQVTVRSGGSGSVATDVLVVAPRGQKWVVH